MRHGLLAKTVVLPNEDGKLFETFFYLCIDRFSPVDDVEMSMVEDMAASIWRLRRAMAMENSIFESGMETRLDLSPIQQTTAAFCDPRYKEDLDRLQRYQARLQNTYQRALRNLALLRKIPRRPDPPPEELHLPNEPRTPCVCTKKDPQRPSPAPAPAVIRRPDPDIVPFDPLVSP
jgi:hypothetical protein